MARVARDGRVTTFERKTRRRVLVPREARRMPALDVMTALARAAIGAIRELSGVRVAVAVVASAVRSPQQDTGRTGVLARPRMARLARERSVPPLEQKRCGRVARVRERRGAKRGDVVARRAVHPLAGERRAARVSVRMARAAPVESGPRDPLIAAAVACLAAGAAMCSA
jgi:hypothetical protein